VCRSDNVAEWLRRQPAKLMGFARVGSNPIVVDFYYYYYYYFIYLFIYLFIYKKKRKKRKGIGRTGSRARVKRITTAYANHYTIRPHLYCLCGSMDRAPDF
jgi:hypothetical protein